MPTLPRKETCLLDSMRIIKGDSTQGQFFEWAFAATDIITNTQYANLVTFYLAKEQQADAGTLYGTNAAGSAYKIKTFEEEYPGVPVRPNPLTGRP